MLRVSILGSGGDRAGMSASLLMDSERSSGRGRAELMNDYY